MRRRVTSVLLFVALFLPSLSLFATDSQNALPPCCRVGGKHHCAMIAKLLRKAQQPSISDNACPFHRAAGKWIASLPFVATSAAGMSAPVVADTLREEQALAGECRQPNQHAGRAPPAHS